MKRTLLSAIAALGAVMSSSATDLVVEEFGTLPAYSSIQAAVTAAVDGDRILIKNRAGLIPWIEDVTIDKSVQLLSFDNDDFFIVQGDYTINSAVGREVAIIGMKNTVGHIQQGTTSTDKATTLQIMDSWLMSGNIALPHGSFWTEVASSQLDQGYVQVYWGAVIGNDVTADNTTNEAIEVAGSGAVTGDTIFVVGNKVHHNSISYDGIYLANNRVIYHVKNNFVTHRDNGITMSTSANISTANLIWNNTILSQGTSSVYGIYITSNQSNMITEVMNNVVDETTTSTSYGIYGSLSSGQVNVYYNHVDASHNTPILASFTFVGNNQTAGSLTIDANGNPGAAESPIDGGNPAAPYYDLDLTVGDAGCYGGSYTLDNFFPLFTGGARVYMVEYPFNVRSGNTLDVEGRSFDR